MSELRASLWVFHDVIIPSWLEHRLRTLLTLIGVIIGVQVVVAVSLVNRSTIASFEYTAQTIAGSADVQIASGTIGVPEDLIARVAALPGVTSAAGLVQATLRTDWGPLTLFGADLLGDQRIRQTQFPKKHVKIPDELRFVNARDSIAVSTSFADRASLALGSQLIAIGPTGRITLTVRGFLDPVGPVTLFGGAVALADLPTAQEVGGLADRVDQIDIKVADGANVEQVIATVSDHVKGLGTVGPPRDRALRLGSMLASLQMVLTVLGLFSIIVGIFIIYHTMQTAILQRRRDLALSRAVGFSAASVVGAVTLEAFTLGTIGAAAGVLLGVAGARLSLGVVTSGISAIWAPIDHPRLALTFWDVALGALLGIGISLAAAIVPSRRLLTMKVLEHLRSDAEHAVSGLRRTPIVAGTVLLTLGSALPYLDLRPDTFAAKIAYIMTTIVVLAVAYVLLAPTLVQPLLRLLAATGGRLPGIRLALATDHLARNANRGTSATPALMCAFAMVLIAGSFITSLKGSLLTWIEQTFAADLGVLASSQLALPASPTLPPSVEAAVKGVPGVLEVSPSRAINVPIDAAMTILRTESRGGMQLRNYPVVESDGTDWLDRFNNGGGVVVSENLAFQHRLKAHDTIELGSPSGRIRFTIVAVVVDYTLDIGAILIEWETYKRLWKDDLTNGLNVWVEPKTDVSAVRSRIAESVPPDIPITIITGAEFKRTVSDALDGALVMTYAIQLLAITIALIGLVNFFLAEIEDRRREIGILRAVALDKRDLLRVLLVEALILGSLGGIMAVLYAWPVSMMLVTRSVRLISGLRLGFLFPYGLAVVTIVVAALTSMLAAYYPFRRAAAVPIADLVTVE